MKNELIEVRYYNTYYYANIINNLLTDRFAYLRTLHDLFENDGHLRFIEAFPKHSALHKFIEFCVELEFYEDFQSDYTQEMIRKGTPKLPINMAFEFYRIEHTTFQEWIADQSSANGEDINDQLYDYFVELRLEQSYEDLMNQIADEVFYIMFMNRNALELLNDLIAGYIADVTLAELEDDDRRFFTKDGALRRTSIPEWVRKAVYHRDRGCCTNCNRDLTGLITLSNEDHFDHIVPLAEGGINDITNIQLLCAKCNLQKGKKIEGSSTRYERWYPK